MPCRLLRFAAVFLFSFLAASCADTDPDTSTSTCEDAGCAAEHRECHQPMDANATCGSCVEGYAENNGVCRPIAELPPCTTHPDVCEEGTCVDTDDHYTCNCPGGFEFDGTTCVDIDECAQSSDLCEAREACINTPGSYTCECMDGMLPSEIGCQPRMIQVAAGETASCAITEDKQLYCWGSARYGELGTGERMTTLTPPTLVDGDLRWRDIQLGSKYACGITTDNDLYCWGANRYGQLGIGLLGDSDSGETTPTAVEGGHKWLHVAVNDGHTCGITEDQKLYCWGDHESGQLGFLPEDADDASPVLSPIPVLPSLRWSHVALGYLHTCAITTDAELYCWGDNYIYHMGADMPLIAPPTRIDAQRSWSDLSLGDLHTCGISEGELYCWGDGYSGATGLGHEDLVTEPTRVGSETGWTMLSGKYLEGCALRNEEAYCWGRHTADRSEVTILLEPTPMNSHHKWSHIDLGADHGCGIREGLAHCWGEDALGQAGFEGFWELLTPKPVQFFP